VTDERLGWELTTSRTDLASHPAYRNVFAYPYGDPDVVTARTRQAAREAGFDAAFTTYPAPVATDADRWAINRIGVEDWTLDVFRWAIDRAFRTASPPREPTAPPPPPRTTSATADNP
jgi:hypothetical protein